MKPKQNQHPLRYSIYSLIAVVAAMIFFFPIYWAFSTSLRNPLDTFTVSGFGIPFLNFDPTLTNWVDQLATEEARKAVYNSTVIAVFASILALVLGIPAAYALARFRFKTISNKDLTIWFLSQRVIPPVATVVILPDHAVSESIGHTTGTDPNQRYLCATICGCDCASDLSGFAY